MSSFFDHELAHLQPEQLIAVAQRHGWQMKEGKRPHTKLLTSPGERDKHVLVVAVGDHYDDQLRVLRYAVEHFALWLLEQEIGQSSPAEANSSRLDICPICGGRADQGFNPQAQKPYACKNCSDRMGAIYAIPDEVWNDAVKSGDFKAIIQKHIDEHMATRLNHIEAFAAAYLRMTHLPADEAQLIERRDGTTTRWWFEKRGPSNKPLAPATSPG